MLLERDPVFGHHALEVFVRLGYALSDEKADAKAAFWLLGQQFYESYSFTLRDGLEFDQAEPLNWQTARGVKRLARVIRSSFG